MSILELLESLKAEGFTISEKTRFKRVVTIDETFHSTKCRTVKKLSISEQKNLPNRSVNIEEMLTAKNSFCVSCVGTLSDGYLTLSTLVNEADIIRRSFIPFASTPKNAQEAYRTWQLIKRGPQYSTTARYDFSVKWETLLKERYSLEAFLERIEPLKEEISLMLLEEAMGLDAFPDRKETSFQRETLKQSIHSIAPTLLAKDQWLLARLETSLSIDNKTNFIIGVYAKGKIIKPDYGRTKNQYFLHLPAVLISLLAGNMLKESVPVETLDFNKFEVILGLYQTGGIYSTLAKAVEGAESLT